MVDPVTTNMQFAVPTRGSDVGTWDVPLNGDWNIADAAFGSVTSKSLTNVNISLTATEAQAAVLRFSGTLTGNVIVTLPSIVKFWTVQNLCTGNFYVQLSTGSGQVIALPPANPVDVFSDGTNVYFKNLPPVGSYLDYANANVANWILNCTVPPYLYCNGGTFSAVTYPVLNALLGGTTLPDLRGRTRYALDGGTGRITSGGSGLDGNVLLAGGGFQNRPINQINLPAINPTGTVTISDTRTWGATGANGSAGGNSTTQFLNAPTDTASNSHSVSVTSGTITASFAGDVLGSGTALTTLAPGIIAGITLIRAG